MILYLHKFISVSPQIHPFSFGEETINSGEFITVICAISKGDLPINITWTLNGRSITEFDGIDTGTTKSRTSQLTIESVQAHHSGKYTCFAHNLAGTDYYSSFLNVNGSLINSLIYIIYPFIKPSEF